jgi:pseudouridine-5'-phosphate glycosidase
MRGGKWKIHTQEEMYYEILSDSPEINYTLYIMHKANINAYLDIQKTLPFMENRKIPVQNLVNKENHFVKAIVNGIS